MRVTAAKRKGIATARRGTTCRDLPRHFVIVAANFSLPTKKLPELFAMPPLNVIVRPPDVPRSSEIVATFLGVEEAVLSRSRFTGVILAESWR